MTPWVTPLPSHPATAQRLRHPHGRGGGLHPGRLPHQRRPAGDGERGAAAESSPPNPGCVPAPPPSLGDHLSSLLVCCGGRGALGPSAAPRPPPQTLLVEFYRGAPDLVKFQELWSHDQTYLDKLKVGIYPPRSSQQLIRGLCCTPVRSKAQSARGEPSQQLLSAGLPGLPHPQGSELRPHPGADLRPAEAQQLSRSCAGEQRLRAALQGCSTACCAQRANGRTQSQQRGARGQGRAGGSWGPNAYSATERGEIREETQPHLLHRQGWAHGPLPRSCRQNVSIPCPHCQRPREEGTVCSPSTAFIVVENGMFH